MVSQYSKRSFEEITRAILEQLTKGVVDEKHIYDPSKVRYRLGAKERVRRVSKVEGLVKGNRHLFSEGSDFRLAGDMLEWTGEASPDPMSPFRVSYTFGDPSPISDVNPGSVVRTLVEAISREIEYLYLQMDYVYESGFINTAQGAALDQVVALLGARRRPAQKARGEVVFGRKGPPPVMSSVEETLLYRGLNEYSLKQSPIRDVSEVRGRSEGSLLRFKKGTDYALLHDSLVWVAGGRSPNHGSEFTVRYTPYQRIVVPVGTKVSTFAKRAEDSVLFTTVAAVTLTKSQEGLWEAQATVEAEVPGASGNVLSGTITLMPKPVEGIEYVINRRSMTGGSPTELDEELRVRAKGELKSLGRATQTALKQRVEDVAGVVRPVKIQELPVPFMTEVDGSAVSVPIPGVVRIIVDGGELEEIERVVEETRAAGVLVEVARPRPVLLSVQAVVELERGADLERIRAPVQDKLGEYVDSLETGETVVYSRVISLLLSEEGVRDVRSLVLQAYRAGESTSLSGNLVLEQDEKARLRDLSVKEAGSP